ncbi:hypothetical protein SDRG_13997 [Saprolegnia diclina VS20]|uniref:START domain-containing protein n=1 Tax=Saprolegnia diclina (strain VS20) TaxID=1156394 RepID=T0Q415_SAPDV|nr:hypothetical protein SDRG_13997 [Saprolegnia diclina VS20]EQC28170.1 hypothetical protein SDRG_13997 [Saprolegnia diclina VS20]|eukprot:XP_008618319.1 hypothetical protein SDRG_13997 [Saprolegnia diclina VS20]
MGDDMAEVLALLQDDAATIETMAAFLSRTTDFASPEVSSDDSATRETRQMKRRLAGNPKEEIEYLQSKHRYLTRQLHTLQERQALVPTDDPWKGRALEQARAAQRSRQENLRLKAMLEDQLKVLEALQRVIAKKPRLSTFPTMADAQWKHGVLDVLDREASLEALMQHQLEKLETAWIRHGLFDAVEANEAVLRSHVETKGQENMTLHFVHCTHIPLDYIAMANLTWEHMTTKLRSKRSEVLEVYHPDLIYVKHFGDLPDPTMPTLEARVVYRRWMQSDRVIIAWHTILDDKLLPHSRGNLVENRFGWSVTHRKSPDESMLAVYGTMTTPSMHIDDESAQPAVGTLTELLLQMSKENGEKFGSRIRDAIIAYKSTQNALTEH